MDVLDTGAWFAVDAATASCASTVHRLAFTVRPSIIAGPPIAALPAMPVVQMPAWIALALETLSTRMCAVAGPFEESSTASEGHVRELIRETIHGDDSAFAQLIRLHKERVVRLVARFARNTADLDDISQDVFIQMHRDLHRFRGDAPFEHWLCRIATRRCQDYLRKLYRRRWWTSFDALRDEGFEPAPDESPRDPRVELLRAAMARLRPADQTILTLLELQGCSIRETSAYTGWSEGNVKVRAHRARLALRRQIEKLEASGS